MRDLRAELRECDPDVPIEWNPDDGDILVGSVRDSAPDGQHAVIVEEERTGLPILVRLEAPLLAALFELHNPRPGDRVGIKRTGADSNGAPRFTMIIDRAPSPAGNADSSSEDSDDSGGATAEERDFITNLLEDAPTDGIEDSEVAPHEEPINGYLRRQEEELTRQARALERLEALIAPSTSVALTAEKADYEAKRDTDPESRPSGRHKGSWLRGLLIWIMLFVAGAIGAGAAVLLKPAVQLWLKW